MLDDARELDHTQMVDDKKMSDSAGGVDQPIIRSTAIKQPMIGGTAIKPVGWDRTGLQAFAYFLCDPQKGTILTRTPLSWLKIIVFYNIFYSFLAIFWTICLFIFIMTLPYEDAGPKWQLDQGLIGVDPGVAIRPSNPNFRIESQMIVLKANDESSIPSNEDGEGDTNADYAVRLGRFLQQYDKNPAPPIPENLEEGLLAFKGYSKFDLSTLGPCGSFPYGYVGARVKPCILIKLNKIWGWQPAPIEYKEDPYSYNNLPKSLRNHLNSASAKEAEAAEENKNIWIDCAGRNSADKEALEGRLTYYPASRAIPIRYFPYVGERNEFDASVGFHSPLVAIQVDPRPLGQLVHIECRAFYHGVRHLAKEKRGLVHFEVLLT